MRLIFLCFGILSLACFGQSKFSLDVFGTPFIHRYGKTIVSNAHNEHPNIISEYFYYPSQEVGIIFNQRFQNKFGWCTGVSWTNDRRGVRLNCYEDILNPIPTNIVSVTKDVKIQRLALKTGFGYSFNPNIQLDFFISTMFRIHQESIPGKNLDFYVYQIAQQSNLHIQMYENNTIHEVQIIPEIRFSVNVFKGFRIHCGTRLKFWGPYYLSTRVEGSFETVDYSDDLLHRSFMSGADLSYFAGLTYRFEFKRPNQ